MRSKICSLIIAVCSLAFGVIVYLYKTGQIKYILTGFSAIIFLVFILDFFSRGIKKTEYEDIKFEDTKVTAQITELALLNEDNVAISYWQMYGKYSLVIGLDYGENNVDVNLHNTIYASLIDKEHAVLNYSDGKWYVEDNESKNGISVVKSDGKKYRLNNQKPCLVEKGDIIYIALARLQLM